MDELKKTWVCEGCGNGQPCTLVMVDLSGVDEAEFSGPSVCPFGFDGMQEWRETQNWKEDVR
jgi:hypothetical protein